MTATILKLSENPNKYNIEEQKEKVKKEISNETSKNITNEEFEKMSWKDLEKNIRVDKKGHLTLFKRSLKYWIRNINIEWTKDQQEGLNEFLKQKVIIEKVNKQYEQKELLKNILQIWEQEAIQIANSVWFKNFRNDGENILKYIEEINKNLEVGVPIDQKLLDESFNKIFDLIQLGEQEESIIGEDDIKNIKEIFFNKNLNGKEKEIKIFNLMRYGGLSGNSESVKDIVADKLLKTKDFEKQKEILNNPKIKEYLEDKNISKLREILSWEQADKIIEIYNKTNEKLEVQFRHILAGENKKKQKSGEKLLNLEEFKKQNKFIENSLKITFNTFKHILISSKIDEKKYRGNEKKSFEGMYSNLIGLSENKGISDYFVFADENIDNVIDFGVTIAIGAITMGVGIGATVLVKGALAGVRVVNIGNKISKGLKIAKYIEEGTKSRALLGFIGNSTLDGIAFHEGAIVAQNVLFGNLENWKHQALDSNEIVKSIAFMGGLNSLQFVSRISGMTKIMNFEMKIPKEYLEKNTILKVLEGTGNFTIKGLREGSVMFGISGIIEEVLGNGWNPTVKEYLHFVALIQLMHLKDIKK